MCWIAHVVSAQAFDSVRVASAANTKFASDVVLATVKCRTLSVPARPTDMQRLDLLNDV